MKKLICKSCDNSWIIEDKSLELNKLCPFCGIEIRQKKDVEIFNSFEKVMFKAVSDLGLNALTKPKIMSGYMLDLAPQFAKEIHVFFRMSDKNLSNIYQIFNRDSEEAKLDFEKLRHILIDTEGLSDFWADFIRDKCIVVYNMFNGILTEYTFLVDIKDAEDKKSDSHKIAEKIEKMKLIGIESFSCVHGKKNVVEHFNNASINHYQKALELEENNDIEGAINEYLTLTRKNFAPAFVRLGYIQSNLNHIKSSWRWYLKGAELNDFEAMYFVAVHYLTGSCVAKSESNAIKYFKIAAENGVCEAAIALYYINMKNDKRDVATEYLKIAQTYVDNDVFEKLMKDFSVWFDIDNENKIKIRETRKSLGLCQYCGNSFYGIVKKTCSVCGKNKDY